MEKHSNQSEKQINHQMVSWMSQKTVIFNEWVFYIDFTNISTYFWKNINLLNDENKREILVGEYWNKIIWFFNDFKNIDTFEIKKIKIEKIEQDWKNIKISLLEEDISKEALFILEILSFLFKINKKTINFYIWEEKIEYSLLNSEEFIFNNLLKKLDLSENQWEKVNEEIENIIIRLWSKYQIFNKIIEKFNRSIYFWDLHKNEYFWLEFWWFSKANFLATKTRLPVKSWYLDNLTWFKEKFPDIVDVKKWISSQASLILWNNKKNKIKSIEELLEKKLKLLLDKDLNIDNFEQLFTNLGLIIFENLDFQNTFYQSLIWSKNNSSNNAIKLFLENDMKKRFFLLFRWIKNKVLDEINNCANWNTEDITLLKRKILVIFNNFLNTEIYNQILSDEEKQEYINNGILDCNWNFNQKLESAKYISWKNSKYQETKQIINLFLEDESFWENFIYKLFENIFNSVSKKSVYLMTLNMNWKNIDFNLIKENSEILISFLDEKIKISEFIEKYFNSEFNIISITWKLGIIKSILNWDLVLASERWAREILIKTFESFLNNESFGEIKNDLEKLILDLKLVDDFKENKKNSEYDNFPVAFSEIIPQQNILLAYLLSDNLVEKQLSGNIEENEKIDLELEYQTKINAKINIYLDSIWLNRKQAIKKIQDIKYFLELENFWEIENKTDISILLKVLNPDDWISMEGFQLLMQNKILEQKFVESNELKNKLNWKKYINIEMSHFEEELQELQEIYNNTFPEFKSFMEKSFLENIESFYNNLDYKFWIFSNTYSSFLSKIQFYSTVSIKIFWKEKWIWNNILDEIFTKIEWKLINNLNIENYPDLMMFISNLEELWIKEFEYMWDEKQDEDFLKQIALSFDEEYKDNIYLMELIFNMKINFIRKIKRIDFLLFKNDSIIHDYFERMILSKYKEWLTIY